MDEVALPFVVMIAILGVISGWCFGAATMLDDIEENCLIYQEIKLEGNTYSCELIKKAAQ